MEIARDNKQFCAAILIDLSKAFDCTCHDLLIAKLKPYGFDGNALKFIYDYLSDRSYLFRHYLWCTTGIYTWASAA